MTMDMVSVVCSPLDVMAAARLRADMTTKTIPMLENLLYKKKNIAEMNKCLISFCHVLIEAPNGITCVLKQDVYPLVSPRCCMIVYGRLLTCASMRKSSTDESM